MDQMILLINLPSSTVEEPISETTCRDDWSKRTPVNYRLSLLKKYYYFLLFLLKKKPNKQTEKRRSQVATAFGFHPFCD